MGWYLPSGKGQKDLDSAGLCKQFQGDDNEAVRCQGFLFHPAQMSFSHGRDSPVQGFPPVLAAPGADTAGRRCALLAGAVPQGWEMGRNWLHLSLATATPRLGSRAIPSLSTATAMGRRWKNTVLAWAALPRVPGSNSPKLV